MIRMNRRIMGAFLVGFGLIGGAFLVSKQMTPQQSGSLSVAAGPAAPREFLAVTDSDNDGIPDWQEALQRTEPLVINENNENYELPETITDQFARDFFEQMVRSKNYGAFSGGDGQLIEQAVNSFDAEAKDTLFTTADIKTTPDTSSEAVRAYANYIIAIQNNHPVPPGTRNELDILRSAFTANSTEIIAELDPIIASYNGIVEDTKNAVVPASMAAAHLDYLNAVNAVKNDIEAFRQSFTDPLYAIIRLKRYQEDANALYAAVLQIHKTALEQGAVFAAGDPIVTLFGNQ